MPYAGAEPPGAPPSGEQDDEQRFAGWRSC